MMSEYQEAIKENVYGFLNRMQEVKTETQIQMSVNVGGKRVKDCRDCNRIEAVGRRRQSSTHW
jgi:hypothetical protein